VIPDAEYAKIRPTPPKAAAAQPELARPAPALQFTANGPAASYLLNLLTKAGIASMLPASHPAPTMQDNNAGGPPTTGEVTYVFADGSLLHATQQRLVRPLPYSVVGLAGGAEPLYLSTGTLVVLNHGASFVQVILVSSTGVFTQVTARGVPAQNVPVPMTEGQLRSLAETIDREMQVGS
jgi:hypothetical protein